MIGMLIIGFCSAVFIGIGIYAIRKKTPMWFYTGSEEEIDKETFYDVKPTIVKMVSCGYYMV